MKYVTLVLAILVVSLFIIAAAQDRRIEALEAAPMTLGQATGTPQIMTVLVGQGCVGAAGPNKIMIGLDEDEFSHCDAIDVHELVIVQ